MIRAARAFQAAGAGLKNAQAALELALKAMPNIDPERIFAAGHSSAGGHALYLAAEERRIRAVAAYAPVTVNRDFARGELMEVLSSELPGFAKYLDRSSPMQPQQRSPGANLPLRLRR